MPRLQPRSCEIRDLGRVEFGHAYALQQDLVSQRKQGLIPDQLLLLEHPHVITIGRNGHRENLLASEEILQRSGIELHTTDRGGDVTYHGPGQLVGYPILDLKDWKRDVVAYVRGLEQVIIETLGSFEIQAARLEGCTGVWVGPAKIAAIGVHLSRWVTSHGFALNIDTDLNYFRYIVPCGLSKPVTSLRDQGCQASRAQVAAALLENFANVFEFELVQNACAMETIA
ncbi:MAG: lipoyl(octanoyl) transferase LipB [Acidobacteriia bacterium]|nr:lipoyl(octanoyl) transferase LipB [Terriglobia bacterium]